MRLIRNCFFAPAAGLLLMLPSLIAQAPNGDAGSTIWRFDNIDSIGGHATHVFGHPHLIDSPLWQGR